MRTSHSFLSGIEMMFLEAMNAHHQFEVLNPSNDLIKKKLNDQGRSFTLKKIGVGLVQSTWSNPPHPIFHCISHGWNKGVSALIEGPNTYLYLEVLRYVLVGAEIGHTSMYVQKRCNG